MTLIGRRARVVHAIPGRLRIRFEGAASDGILDALAAVRVAPGVLAVESKPASRSAVVQYDPAATTEAAVLDALVAAGIVVTVSGASSPASGGAGSSGAAGSAGRASSSGAAGSSGGASSAPTGVERESAPAAEAPGDESGARSALWETLVGPPPKLDRRFAESLALSAVSLMVARQVAPMLGGGTTLPAYFAIWFALRRMTGLGRRR